MADYPVNNDDRVKALSETALPYFVHWRVVMKLLCIPSKEEFDAFIEGIKAGGRYSLGGISLPAIDIDVVSEDNILHLHRLRIGDRASRSEPITDSPSHHVLTQVETFYGVGLLSQEPGTFMQLKDQIKVLKLVMGLARQGVAPEDVEARKKLWRGCYTGGDADNRSYYNTQLPKVIVKHHRLLRMEQMSLSDVTIEMMDRARDMIAKMMEYSHVLEMRSITPTCIVRRSSNRGTDMATPPSSPSPMDRSPTLRSAEKQNSVKQRKRRSRTKRDQPPDLGPLQPESEPEDIPQYLDPDLERIAREKQLLSTVDWTYISMLWAAGDAQNRLEVGRIEVLLYGVWKGWSYARINSTIRQYGGLPFSINDYNALDKMNDRGRILSRKYSNFDKLRVGLIA